MLFQRNPLDLNVFWRQLKKLFIGYFAEFRFENIDNWVKITCKTRNWDNICYDSIALTCDAAHTFTPPHNMCIQSMHVRFCACVCVCFNIGNVQRTTKSFFSTFPLDVKSSSSVASCIKAVCYVRVAASNTLFMLGKYSCARRFPHFVCFCLFRLISCWRWLVCVCVWRWWWLFFYIQLLLLLLLRVSYECCVFCSFIFFASASDMNVCVSVCIQ